MKVDQAGLNGWMGTVSQLSHPKMTSGKAAFDALGNRSMIDTFHLKFEAEEPNF